MEGWEKDFKSVHEARNLVVEIRRELRELGRVMIEGGEWKHLSFDRWGKIEMWRS